MATKKQKREAAQRKREAFEESVRLTGLEALRKDQDRRRAQAKRAEEEAQKPKRQKSVKKAVSKLRPAEKVDA